jgi:hypothetical protein
MNLDVTDIFASAIGGVFGRRMRNNGLNAKKKSAGG